MKTLILLLLVFHSMNVYSKTNKKVTYKYKKFERFDMDDLNIEGDMSNPGDLSIDPRFRRKFKNRLPSRPNFKREMLSSIEAIR